MFDLRFDADGLVDRYLQKNGDAIRRRCEEIARERVAAVIGEENLSKVTLTFSGSNLDNLTMHVDGPNELKAKIQAARRSGTL